MVDSGRRPLLTVRKNRNGVAVNNPENTNIVYNFFSKSDYNNKNDKRGYHENMQKFATAFG